MDTSNSADKIADVVIKVNEYVDKIIELRKKYIGKINKCLTDLETVINDAVDKINSGVDGALKWLEIKIAKITKKIQDILDNIKKKIDSIIKGLRTWYNTTVNNIKANVIMAVFAKTGIECTHDTAMAVADTIPHPSIDSLLPSFEIDLQIELPNMSGMVSIEKVSLPRL